MRAAAFALCMLLAACGANRASPTTPATAPESPMPGTPREQIEELEAKIAGDRDALGLAEPSDAEVLTSPAQPMGATPAIEDPTCKPATTDTCRTSCTLSDSICTNADKICKLALELDSDWARGKCVKANETCKASRIKCCGCR